MFIILFSYLILLRLGELILAERNRRWAIARGGQHCIRLRTARLADTTFPQPNADRRR